MAINRIDELPVPERLQQAENLIEALRNNQVDAIVTRDQVAWLRLKQVEEQLAAEENITRSQLEELELIYQNAPVGLCVFDTELRYVKVNKWLAEINGFPAADHIGKTMRDMIPYLADAVEPLLRKVIESGEPIMNLEISGEPTAQPGITRYWLEHWLPLHDAEGAVVGVNVVAEEITERKRAEAQMLELKKDLERQVRERTEVSEQRAMQLQAMTLQLSEAEEMERRRLGQVLHDSLQQLIVAAKYKLAMLKGAAAKGADIAKHAVELEKILDDSIQTSRSLSHELSPPVMHQDGLCAALKWLGQSIQQKHGLLVNFEGPAEIKIPKDMGIFLCQSVRELLFNAVKYAEVPEAFIRVECHDGELRVSVEDRGKGFDTSILESAELRGIGLTGVRERIELLGGRLEVESTEEKGSRFLLVLPLRGNL